ncbi:unnamed protein product [Rotaria sp. Silwood2]|nr:unnamed protein product [Rotaria sp. Silwood2]CAF3291106.1 unnamed protein product [Rotaria sp. Silwood2]CAF4059273.1 unnamed protein product [Rotaria sp. Silwood2]CAF4538180.1 unnamed protein product [Rotaria sp. Silwood2]CAF4670945.1 unnamed protein product [Rotaria sp. Silwood2]
MTPFLWLCHSKWFVRCMLNHNYNLVFDFQIIYNTIEILLYCLNLWCLVLLVHKWQIQPINSMTKLFRVVFTCLSSGILLTNKHGSGIIEQCEKDLVDVAIYLTNEQRLIITTYAKDMLHLIAFEIFNNPMKH